MGIYKLMLLSVSYSFWKKWLHLPTSRAFHTIFDIHATTHLMPQQVTFMQIFSYQVYTANNHLLHKWHFFFLMCCPIKRGMGDKRGARDNIVNDIGADSIFILFSKKSFITFP